MGDAMTKSKLFFSLDAIKSQSSNGSGNITYVTSDEMPGLVNMAFATLKLNKGSAEEPIWHPNAHKIGYCHKGSAQISIRTPSNYDTFTIKAGDVFFIPQGYIHHIANMDPKETVIHFAWNNPKPQVMSLANAICSLSDDVFSSTFNTSADFLNGLKKSKKQEMITALSSTPKSSPSTTSRYKFNIAESGKPIQTKGGYLQTATKKNLPILEGLGILGFGLNPKGIVEPHWHTNAGELVFIVKGNTRITVLSPDGNVETLEVNAGQGAFAPASHFHNIENVGKDNVEVIAYFSHAEPDYIGVAEALGAYSNEMLESTFNVSPHYFDKLKKIEAPLVIVPV